MKKPFLLLCLLISIASTASAQMCMPDTTLADSIIVFPLPYIEGIDSTGIQDTACANTYFETVVNVNIPSSVEILGSPVGINGIVINEQGAFLDLPASMDYVCNPPDCMFPAETVGCITLFGTPTEEEIGMYDLKIAVKLLTGFINLDFVLPDGNLVEGNYFLFIKEEGSEACNVTSINELTLGVIEFSTKVVPNPSNGFSQLQVDSSIGGEFDLNVFDLTGKSIAQRRLRINEGENSIDLDITDSPNGIYFYSLSNDDFSTTGKIVKQ